MLIIAVIVIICVCLISEHIRFGDIKIADIFIFIVSSIMIVDGAETMYKILSLNDKNIPFASMIFHDGIVTFICGLIFTEIVFYFKKLFKDAEKASYAIIIEIKELNEKIEDQKKKFMAELISRDKIIEELKK